MGVCYLASATAVAAWISANAGLLSGIAAILAIISWAVGSGIKIYGFRRRKK